MPQKCNKKPTMCDIGFQVKYYAVRKLLGDSCYLVENHLVKLVLEI